jgi:hypothetical protein
MATEDNPLDPQLSLREKNRLFGQFSYDNFNGVSHTVDFSEGQIVKVEHGLGFAPTLEQLTARAHWRLGNVGNIWMAQEPDDKYVYLQAERTGKARIELAHPNKE